MVDSPRRDPILRGSRTGCARSGGFVAPGCIPGAPDYDRRVSCSQSSATGGKQYKVAKDDVILG